MGQQVRRFDFDNLRDFQAPLQPPEVVVDNTLPEVEDLAPPPPPSFSEEEMQAAKAAAWEEGRQAGIQEEAARQQQAGAERQQRIESMAQQLVQHANQLTEKHQAFMQRQMQEIGQLTLMLARKVAGDAVAQFPQQTIESVLEECLPILQEQPHIYVTVNPELEVPLQEMVPALVNNQFTPVTFEIKADPSLAIGDARIEWKEGSIQRSQSEIWQQIETIVLQTDFTTIVPAKASTESEQHQPRESTHE